MFIGVCVGSNGGNSFELAEVLKRDLQSILSSGEAGKVVDGGNGTDRSRTSDEAADVKDAFGGAAASDEINQKSKTSENFCFDRIERQRVVNNLSIEVEEMDSICIDKLHTASLVIFVCSTTGDGDAPYNMQAFWQEIKRKSWNGAFSFYFCVVGLGDSSYKKYNYAGKRLFNRLKQVGGIPLCRRCDCDDMDPMGVYSEYKKWLVELKDAILKDSMLKDSLLKDSSTSIFEKTKENSTSAVFLDKNLLSSNDLLSYGSMYSAVYEYNFRIEKNNYEYSVGDVLSIIPTNTDYRAVSSLIFLDDADFVSKHLDYNAVPMQHKIQHLYELVAAGEHAHIFCPPESLSLYMDKLKEISTSYDAYYSYILQEKRSFKNVLVDFYIKVSVESNLFRKILPRYYTISKRNGSLYSITAGKIEVLHKNKKILGVCSEYLYNLEKNSEVTVDIKKSHLVLDEDILVISTGTGIALGRTILNECLMGRMKINSLSIVFGFRELGVDFLHSSELQNESMKMFQNNGYMYILSEDRSFHVKIFICPSRIRNDSGFLSKHGIDSEIVREKNYLNGILEIIDKDELKKSIILCGSVRLLKTIPSVLQRITNMSIKPQSECW
ncbi:hypothetical protein NEMIN01_1431 [Nematocida minor]|uniref:uncharacterized protein n=1 Tax=Nematocida minor TaxID=1912983 RepID=UPI00221FCB61|nr:uncharacterized protein NEMIN01_1431 [Nematocida minor]KAI5191223.1 hypothetical protein NEMIN01_1431 [Nematocida minor]